METLPVNIFGKNENQLLGQVISSRNWNFTLKEHPNGLKFSKIPLKKWNNPIFIKVPEYGPNTCYGIFKRTGRTKEGRWRTKYKLLYDCNAGSLRSPLWENRPFINANAYLMEDDGFQKIYLQMKEKYQKLFYKVWYKKDK